MKRRRSRPLTCDETVPHSNAPNVIFSEARRSRAIHLGNKKERRLTEDGKVGRRLSQRLQAMPAQEELRPCQRFG
jgi:hypothetical protein